ncbi:MAG TPA: hypothetical protein VFP59_06230 [Candidatus Angelobacter sp.]|nr:hypothetical protein [Candidatus Angelobacter sp.]
MVHDFAPELATADDVAFEEVVHEFTRRVFHLHVKGLNFRQPCGAPLGSAPVGAYTFDTVLFRFAPVILDTLVDPGDAIPASSSCFLLTRLMRPSGRVLRLNVTRLLRKTLAAVVFHFDYAVGQNGMENTTRIPYILTEATEIPIERAEVERHAENSTHAIAAA